MFSVPPWHMAESGGGDGAGTKGQHVIHDRQVVHREIPQHVDVVLEQAQIHAHGIVVINFAQRATLDEFTDLPDGAGVDEGVIDHQNAISLLRHVHQMLHLIGARSERLLDQHMLALPAGHAGQFIVSGDRSGDRDRVDRRILDQFAKVAGRLDRRDNGYSGEPADRCADR